MKWKHATFREMGGYHLLALWYPSIILGYPLVVLILGHSLEEGWQFLEVNRGIGIALIFFPLAFIALSWLLDRLMCWITADDEPPTTS